MSMVEQIAVFAAKGAAILLLALVVTRLLRRQPAAVRHTVWLTALLAQLLTPALGALLPAWRLGVDLGPLAAITTVASSELPNGDVAGLPAVATATALSTPTSFALLDDGRALGAQSTTRSAAQPASAVQAAPSRPMAWTTIALIVWGAGAAAVLLWVVVGSLGVKLIARRAVRVTDGEWLTLATALSSEMGLHRPVVLMRGRGLAVPVTWGVLVPVVLLPIDADTWSTERRRTVLLHELAHVRRLDMLSQLAAHVVLALCWFDPLVWVGVRALRPRASARATTA